jgi:hypothetical protein
MIVDACLIIDVVADPGLRAVANRPGHPLRVGDVEQALRSAQSLGISIDATPWADVHRAWILAGGSLRHADAAYVATASRPA